MGHRCNIVLVATFCVQLRVVASIARDVGVRFAAPDQGAEGQLRVNDAVVHNAPEYTAITPKLVAVGTSRVDVVAARIAPEWGRIVPFSARGDISRLTGVLSRPCASHGSTTLVFAEIFRRKHVVAVHGRPFTSNSSNYD